MTSPTKPTDDRYRLLRGGSWYDSSATVVRAAFRFGYSPSYRNYFVGFRCAQRGCRQPILTGVKAP